MEYALTFAFIVAIPYAIILFSRLESRLDRLSFKLDQIGEKLGVDNSALDDELRQLVRDGKDVEAVRIARERLGLSLVQGKRYVDALKAEDEMPWSGSGSES